MGHDGPMPEYFFFCKKLNIIFFVDFRGVDPLIATPNRQHVHWIYVHTREVGSNALDLTFFISCLLQMQDSSPRAPKQKRKNAQRLQEHWWHPKNYRAHYHEQTSEVLQTNIYICITHCTYEPSQKNQYLKYGLYISVHVRYYHRIKLVTLIFVIFNRYAEL